MLTALIWTPLLGALLLSIWPKLSGEGARKLALGVAGVSIAESLFLLSQFDPHSQGMQFVEQLSWIQSMGLDYAIGVDGLAIPLVVLNAFLVWIAVYSSERQIPRPRLYYILVLLLSGGVMGAFLAQNLLLFFLFYEVELIPLYLLIAIWGGPRREYAATKFLLYTALSGILMLGSFLGLAWSLGATNFNYASLQTQSALPVATQIILLGVLLLAFGIKTPLVPVHTWLPDAHVEASTPVSVLLAGVLLKLGTYGIIRFGMGLFPEAWVELSPWLAYWAVASVLYGSFMAIAQKDIKKLVAYSSIGHMGYVLLAAAAATPLSIGGAIAQMISHGLISALLFLLVGVVYKKTGTRDLTILRGLLNPERGMPLVGSLMVLGVMASAGIPGMCGFIAEFIIFHSSFSVFPLQTLLCMVGTGLTAVYFLLLVNRAFFGRLPERLANLPRIQWNERLPAFLVAGLIVIFGLQPNWMLRWSESTVQAIMITRTTLAKNLAK